MKKTLSLFWAILIAVTFSLSPVMAAASPSPQDSLSADGPYILYNSDSVRMIEVDVHGNISIRQFSKLPDGFTFQVTDHRGKFPF